LTEIWHFFTLTSFLWIQIFLRILSCLESGLARSRLVSRRWDEMASDVFKKAHQPIQFRSTREVNYFLYTMMDRLQPQFLSKFVLDLHKFSREITLLFANGFGIHTLEYTLVLHHSACELDFLTLMQHSPNIVTLTLKNYFSPGLTQSNIQLKEWHGESLPAYPNLRRIVWQQAIHCFKLIAKVIERAPGLQYLSCEAMCMFIHPIKDSKDLSHLCPLLPMKTEVETEIRIYKFDECHLEPLRRMCENRNRISTLDVSFLSGALNSEWVEAMNAFLSSQSASLRCLSIWEISKTISVPRLNALKKLRLYVRVDMPMSSVLCLSSFPYIEKLVISGNQYFTLSSSLVWSSVTSLSVFAIHKEAEYALVMRLWEVFPNLDKFRISTYPAYLKATLGYFMKSVNHVKHLGITLLETSSSKILLNGRWTFGRNSLVGLNVCLSGRFTLGRIVPSQNA